MLALMNQKAKSKERERKDNSDEKYPEKKKKRTKAGVLRLQIDFQDLEVTIVPEAGLWKDAKYTFIFKVPDDYPHKAPKVTLKEKIYHPNIDTDGAVCLNLLREDWKPIL